jgi:hypothetical protein
MNMRQPGPGPRVLANRLRHWASYTEHATMVPGHFGARKVVDAIKHPIRFRPLRATGRVQA